MTGDLLATQTALLFATADRLPADSVGHPSWCTGWTRGHVLTHLARAADAVANLATWARTGVEVPMYASAQARDADIEAGATRPMAELLADLHTSTERLDDAMAALGPEHDSVDLRLRNGRVVHARDLPSVRLREVAYHHVDLDAGFGFADLPADLQARFLHSEVRGLADRDGAPDLELVADEGDTFTVGDRATAQRVSGSRAQLLTWLARRIDTGLRSGAPLPELPFGG